uniref:ENTH domain-containing protein n=1 Tax=Compsopogon caeruleus TaxID=31354 RepID=A0A7S1XGM9_9RHOD
MGGEVYGSSGTGFGAGGSPPGGPSVGEYYAPSKPKSTSFNAKVTDFMKHTKAAAKADNWKVVVVKATNHDVGPPKAKHVRSIMQGLQWGGTIANRESPAGGIFYHLRKRLLEKDWIVVLKALTIYHHIFREGNEKFTAYVAANARGLFSVTGFGDSSSEGYAYSGFIRSYSQYLEQWCAMKAVINYPAGKSMDSENFAQRFEGDNLTLIVNQIPILMDTIVRLQSMEIGGQVRYSPVANPTMIMLLKDLTHLWGSVMTGLKSLTERFFSMDQSLAPEGLKIYQRYLEMVERSSRFFEVARQLLPRWNPPAIDSIPKGLTAKMEDYIKNGPETELIPEEFSDEEEEEPEPEPYYEPDPVDYYSESDPEPEPIYREETPPPPSSSEEEEEEEEEEDEEEEEEPAPPPPPQPYDPLKDLLGIEGGQNVAGMQKAGMAMPGMSNLGGMMNMGRGAPNMASQMGGMPGSMAGGYGQIVPYGRGGYMGPPAQQNMAMMGGMAGGYGQIVPYGGGYMAPGAQQSMGMMGGYGQLVQYGGYMGQGGAPQNMMIPAMPAERVQPLPQSYRVHRNTKPSRVNADDKAFGGLVESMKQSALNK